MTHHFYKLEKVDNCWHQIHQHSCAYTAVSVKQSTVGCINRCDDEYCRIALDDAYRIFDNNQHCILCIGNPTFAIITMTNVTYYMCDPHSHDVKVFQNKGAVVLLPILRWIISMFTYASSTIRCDII